MYLESYMSRKSLQIQKTAARRRCWRDCLSPDIGIPFTPRGLLSPVTQERVRPIRLRLVYLKRHHCRSLRPSEADRAASFLATFRGSHPRALLFHPSQVLVDKRQLRSCDVFCIETARIFCICKLFCHL